MSADAGRGAIMILTKDLLFSVSIRNAVLRLGFTARIVKSPEALSEALLAASPALAIVDLSTVGANGDWDTIQEVAERPTPVLVFGPHKDVEGLRAAKAAGVTRVVSNGQFHREMAQLIERYATGHAPTADDVDVADDDDTPDGSGSLPPGIDGFGDHDSFLSAPQR
jgi:DNA-binding NarL/FixJ family response regulator